MRVRVPFNSKPRVSYVRAFVVQLNARQTTTTAATTAAVISLEFGFFRRR